MKRKNIKALTQPAKFRDYSDLWSGQSLAKSEEPKPLAGFDDTIRHESTHSLAFIKDLPQLSQQVCSASIPSENRHPLLLQTPD